MLIKIDILKNKINKNKFLNDNLILNIAQFDHFEFRKFNPKLEKIRLCFESRSKNNLFLNKNEVGRVLYLIQLYIR